MISGQHWVSKTSGRAVFGLAPEANQRSVTRDMSTAEAVSR